MDRLRGKRALITGGSSGIGLETARQFVAEGARVAITTRDPEAFQSARLELGDGLLYIPCDAGDAPGQQQLAEKLKREFGKLDAVFVNAGLADLKPIEQCDEVVFDRSFNINVREAFFPIRALLPIFSDPVSIILNASINAHIGHSFRRAHRARDSRECDQPRTGRDTSVQQTRALSRRPEGYIGSSSKPDPGETFR